MIRVSLNIAIGMLLSGCTVNNFHSGSFNTTDLYSTNEVNVVQTESVKEEVKELPPTPMIVGNTRIRPECGPYVPLPVPKPIQIDFKELDAATSSKDINAIALRNVKDLHLQINTYASRQRAHYAEYVQRCVVR